MNSPTAASWRRSGRLPRAGLHAIMWGVGLVYVLPLVWMAAVSVKGPTDASVGGVDPLPRVVVDGEHVSRLDGRYWGAVGGQARENYAEVWESPLADFPLYLHNSAVVTVLGVVGMALSSAVAAYGFSRLRWRGRDAVFIVVVATLMVPQAVLMAPQYVLFKHLGMIGTLLPLWVPSWFGGALSIFLLRQFFLTIPRELDEAAMIDGCSHVGVFGRIILPLSMPAIAVVVLLQAIALWNDFISPLLYLNHQDQYTLALGLHMYQSQHGGVPWNLVMAASALVVAPVLVLYVFARRFFVEGTGVEGVKG